MVSLNKQSIGQVLFAQEKSVESKEKVVDKASEVLDTIKVEQTLAEVIKGDNMFTPSVYAYAVNPLIEDGKDKRYAVLKVSIDSKTLKSVAEQIGRIWDSETRAYAELQSLMAQDVIAKRKLAQEEHRAYIASKKEKEKLANGK